MTRQVVCCIRDRGVDSFGPPFCSPHINSSKRSFVDAVRNPSPDNMMHRHPDDYDLYDLGTFDDQTGVFELHSRPVLVFLGKDALPSKE